MGKGDERRKTMDDRLLTRGKRRINQVPISHGGNYTATGAHVAPVAEPLADLHGQNRAGRECIAAATRP
jgi:hypothetical protein